MLYIWIFTHYNTGKFRALKRSLQKRRDEKMKKSWKRLFAFVLTIALVFSMLPNAFAARNGKFGRIAKEPSAEDYAAVDAVW